MSNDEKDLLLKCLLHILDNMDDEMTFAEMMVLATLIGRIPSM